LCGIAGLIADASEAPVRRMVDALRHRGPDGEGCSPLQHRGHTVGWFGHTRLAVLDLTDAGRQPMTTADGRFSLAFNGEIYNYREVRVELERQGRRFKSRTDSEVVLEAFGTWGERCLGRFRGMFAIAVWDEDSGRLFLARDRLGVKPLYYAARGHDFVFASELRALMGSGLVPRRLSAAGLDDYLRFGSVSDPETIVEGVRALLPGHWLVWQDGRFETGSYWDPARSSAHPAPQRGAPVRNTATARDLLCEAVECRLVSDVPVGVFLSGGMDSSALAGVVRRCCARPLSTFSVVFDEPEFNEAPYSRAVAAELETDHHEIAVTQREVLEALPHAIAAMDQPTADGINTYMISRAARRAGLTVALSGLGGDEVFGGYSSFRTVPRMERWLKAWRRIPVPLRRCVTSTMTGLMPAGDAAGKLALLMGGSPVDPYSLSRTLFLPDLISRLARVSPTAQRGAGERMPADPGRGFDPVNRVSYRELRNYLPNTLLRDSDCMSMAHGLELRAPFVDHRLVEFMLSVPGGEKLDGGGNKPMLARAMRGILPEAISRRAKRGFTFPFQRWMRDDLRPEIERAFGGRNGQLADWMNCDAVRQVWSGFLDGRTSWSRPWALYVLLRWAEYNIC
jgi:asparagine synthase (glutamine-hydrolysing)